MKMAVFGGAGIAGAAVVERARARGDSVRALLRGAGDRNAGLTDGDIVRGDAFDLDAVIRTVSGTDVIISTLGGYRGPESISSGNANIVTAMRRRGMTRLVILQGFHIPWPGDPRNPAKGVVRAFLTLRCRPLLAHGEALGQMLLSTHDLDWTLVRIPRMVPGIASGRARLGRFALGPVSSVRVGDVASTLLDLADDSAFVRDAPMLFTPRAAD